MSFTFHNAYMFFLFIPLAVLLALAWFRKGPAVRVPSVRTFKAASAGHSRLSLKKLIPFLFFALGGAFLIIALAQPAEGLEEIRRRAEGIDIMIAIDLSQSMEVIDAPEELSGSQVANAVSSGQLKNRLDTAKEEIAKFILARPNDRIGLIAFAPLPYVACPPTLDHGMLISRLAVLEAGMIGGNTGIAGPVASAAQRLKDSDSKRRIVVLFTDGRNNVNAKVTPRQAAKLAEAVGVTVYTVGIGSGNSFIPQQGLFGSTLVPVKDEFDEQLLKDMADSTGGVYYHAADAESMAAAMKAIDQLEKTSVEQNIIVNWKEYYPQFSLTALAFLLLGFLLKHTFCLRIP